MPISTTRFRARFSATSIRRASLLQRHPVFVHQAVYDGFLQKLVARVDQCEWATPWIKDQVGALISEEHMTKVLGFIERGKAEGAKVAVERRITDGALARGFFVAPTVFEASNDAMAIVRDEIFGP